MVQYIVLKITLLMVTWIIFSFRMTDSIGEILKGIRCYFDKALPVMLLYKKERQQYHDLVVDNVSPSTIYGAEHLLRLFGKYAFGVVKCHKYAVLHVILYRL